MFTIAKDGTVSGDAMLNKDNMYGLVQPDDDFSYEVGSSQYKVAIQINKTLGSEAEAQVLYDDLLGDMKTLKTGTYYVDSSNQASVKHGEISLTERKPV